MSNESKEALEAGEYVSILGELTARVRDHVTAAEHETSLFDIHQQIALAIGNKYRCKYIDLFLSDGRALLQKVSSSRATVADSSIFSVAETEDEVLERFTANWLALYFLGTPFVDLWEAVAFFSEGSGFPRGASLCKAVGDVYRLARKSHLQRPFGNASCEKRLYVLDHNPLTMHKQNRESSKGERDKELQEIICELGATYELLQLRLYLESGGPIRFYVPDTSLQRVLSADEGERRAQTRFMWMQLKLAFPKRFEGEQKVHVVHDENLSYMPGCVISPIQGIFRTRENVPGRPHGMNSNPGRAGNYMASRITEEFRNKMEQVNTDNEPTLQSLDYQAFHEKCGQYHR